MQKIIGSIIIILASTAIGFEKSRELYKHLKALEELKKMFTLLKSELEYSKAPIVEVFSKISKKLEHEYRAWLEYLVLDLEERREGTFQELWKASIDAKLGECRLTKEELEELCQLGKSISYIETIELYLGQLELSIEKTREELKTKKKLYQSMGIMGGIFLVIVLL